MDIARLRAQPTASDTSGSNLAQEFLQVASSERPSDAKRSRACFEMLREVEEILNGLKTFIRDADLNGGLDKVMKDPGLKNYIKDRINEAKIKIDALNNQCRDILPKSATRKVDELEQLLDRAKREIEQQTGGSFNIDWSGLADDLGKILGAAAGLAGGVIWLLRGGPLSSPAY